MKKLLLINLIFGSVVSAPLVEAAAKATTSKSSTGKTTAAKKQTVSTPIAKEPAAKTTVIKSTTPAASTNNLFPLSTAQPNTTPAVSAPSTAVPTVSTPFSTAPILPTSSTSPSATAAANALRAAGERQEAKKIIVNSTNATQEQIGNAKAVAPYAAMSFNVYRETQKGITDGWVPVTLATNQQPTSAGFDYQVYEKYKNGLLVEVSIAYKGTDNLKISSENDMKEWLGGPQYVDAVMVAKDTAAKYSQFGIPITTTGHSLGGGLAQAAAFFIPNARAAVFDSSFVDLAGVQRGVNELLNAGNIQYLRNVFGNDLQISPPFQPGATLFTSETNEILTTLVRSAQGVQYNFTNSNPVAAHLVGGFSDMVDGLAKLNDAVLPPVYVMNNNQNYQPNSNVTPLGQPESVNSRFNGAYATPYGVGVSTVRYRDLKFGSDGTTANFTAANAQGQASSAVRNGAGVVGQGQANASGVNFNWGRWAENQGTQLNTSSAGSFVGVPVHYIYADFPKAGIVCPASGAFTFNLVGGTAPTSSVGTSGVLNNMQVRVDFGGRQFQVVNMGVSFAGRNMNLSSTLQPFGQGANASELSSNSTNFIAGNLTGTCTGAACGSNTVGFINGRFAGPNANGIAAGYSVRNSGGSATTINIGGVAGLAR